MAVGHAPVPFQMKTVDGAAFAAGPFVVGPFGHSPPITTLPPKSCCGGVPLPGESPPEVEQRLASALAKQTQGVEKQRRIVAAARDAGKRLRICVVERSGPERAKCPRNKSSASEILIRSACSAST